MTKSERDREFWFEIGKRSALAYLRRRDWLYRRVESIEFAGRGSAHRRVSVDFELPAIHLPPLGDRAAPGGRLVPISTFPKWPPLTDFDFIGPNGDSLSLYVRDTNKALDLGLLMGMAAIVGNLSRHLRDVLALVVSEDRPPAELVAEATRRLAKELTIAISGWNSDRARRLMAIYARETTDLAAHLGNSSVLWVPAAGEQGTDFIVKFSYLDPYGALNHDSHERWKRVLIGCSWWQRTIVLSLPHAGLHTRYHLDVLPPGPGLELTNVQLFSWPGSAEAPRLEPTLPSPVGRDDTVPEYAEIADRRAVIYRGLRDAPSHRQFLRLRIAASRWGFVSGCVVSAMLIGAVMTVVFAWLGAADKNIDSTVVLLGGVPVVLGYVLVRPGLTDYERYQLVGIRAMALAAGAMPILGAFALVLGHNDKSTVVPTVRGLWALLLIASWVLMSGLAMSWLYAARPKPTGGRRRHRDDDPTAGAGSRLGRAKDAIRLEHRIAPTNGALFVTAILAGYALTNHASAVTNRPILARYLIHHRAQVLIGEACVGAGSVMLYGLLARLWQILAPPKTDRKARRRFRWCVIYPGVLWVWLTIGYGTILVWLTLTVTSRGRFAALGALVSLEHIGGAVVLVSGAVFAVGTSLRLLQRLDVVVDPLGAGLMATAEAGLLAVVLLGARFVALMWPSVGQVAPLVPAIGIALYVAVLAMALPTADPRAAGS